MPITAFDHVNLRTTNVEEMTRWYGDILGFTPGPRPDFNIPGVWLYFGDQPLVHLVEVKTNPKAGGDVTMEHFALRATGMAEFLDLLGSRDIDYSIDPVPGYPIVQVNFHDPDGNHIHVDFDRAEMPS